jgi:transcriptional regulator with XRE-family HTH domain
LPRIKELAAKEGWTPKEVADRSGVAYGLEVVKE